MSVIVAAPTALTGCTDKPYLFWATLHDVGLTQADRPLTPQEYRRVLDFGVGLTDLCKFTSGNDNNSYVQPTATAPHLDSTLTDDCAMSALAPLLGDMSGEV